MLTVSHRPHVLIIVPTAGLRLSIPPVRAAAVAMACHALTTLAAELLEEVLERVLLRPAPDEAGRGLGGGDDVGGDAH